jgi:hypothetical protein
MGHMVENDQDLELVVLRSNPSYTIIYEVFLPVVLIKLNKALRPGF